MADRKRAPPRPGDDEPLLPGLEGETREVGEEGTAGSLPGRPPRTRVEVHRRRGSSGQGTSQER